MGTVRMPVPTTLNAFRLTEELMTAGIPVPEDRSVRVIGKQLEVDAPDGQESTVQTVVGAHQGGEPMAASDRRDRVGTLGEVLTTLRDEAAWTALGANQKDRLIRRTLAALVKGQLDRLREGR